MEKIFHKTSLEGDRSVSGVESASLKNTYSSFLNAFRKGKIALRFTGQTPALCRWCYERISEKGAKAGIQKWAVQNGVPVKPERGIQDQGEFIILNFDKKWAEWENLSHFTCGFPKCANPAEFRFAVEDFSEFIPNGGYEYLIIHNKESIWKWMKIQHLPNVSFFKIRRDLLWLNADPSKRR